MDKHWQGEEYALTQIDLASVSSAEIYAVKQGNSMAVAYVMFAKAMGKVDSFIYMIIFKPDGAIELVSVLLYKENYGGEIGSKRFLKQFEGKSNGLNMEYNKDIDGISGATISVQAITRSIKENSANFSNLIKQLQWTGLLNSETFRKN